MTGTVNSTTLADNISSCIVYAFTPIFVSTAYGTIIYGVGPLAIRGNIFGTTRAWNGILYATLVYLLWLSQFSVAAQFVFRYFALCREKLLSFGEYTGLMALAMLLSGFSIPLFIFGNTSSAPLPE